ncbi:DUF1134 domain-containing protein [bacterium]|nr:DUF1134 domain-containing protein [bacterium]
MWRFAVGLVALIAVAPAMSRGADTAGKADATIELEEGSGGVGIGYTWGRGTLHFQGKAYPITISGFSAGELGGTKIQAHGDVYHLKHLSDFNGTYTSSDAGATFGGGFDVEAMRNGNGVEIKMVSTTEGADLKAAVSGVTFTLVK